MKVAVYARVSTESEEQMYALSNQIHYYNEEIKRRPNWDLYQMYVDEGITGTSAKKRKKFLQMIADAKEHKFDIVITREVSRFARNIVDVLHYTRELKALGINVFFIMDNIDTGDKDGELRLSIMSALAQEESRKLSQRVKEGIKSSMQRGNFKSGRPFGYDKTANDDDYSLNEYEADYIRKMFDMYLQGDGIKNIKHMLEQNNVLTPRGNRSWHVSTISRMLKNKFYAGFYEYYKVFRPDYLTQKQKKNWGEIPTMEIQGGHTPIITIDEYEQIQELMKDRTNYTDDVKSSLRGIKRATHVWSGGRVICGCCGTNFKRNSARKLKDGSTPYYFICSQRQDNGTAKKRKELGTDDIKGCDNRYIRGEKLYGLAGYVVEHLWKHKDEELSVIEQVLLNHQKTINYDDLIEKSKQSITKLEQKIQKLLDLYIEGNIDKKNYDKKKIELDSFIEEEKKLLKEYNYKINNAKNQLSEFYKMKDALNDKIDFSKPLPDKIINLVFEKVIVYPNHRVEISFKTGSRFSLSDTEPVSGEMSISEKDMFSTTSESLLRTKHVTGKKFWKCLYYKEYIIKLYI